MKDNQANSVGKYPESKLNVQNLMSKKGQYNSNNQQADQQNPNEYSPKQLGIDDQDPTHRFLSFNPIRKMERQNPSVERPGSNYRSHEKDRDFYSTASYGFKNGSEHEIENNSRYES